MNSIEIIHVENGWIVRPPYIQGSGMRPVGPVFVAETPEKLAEIVMGWATTEVQLSNDPQ